MSNGLMVWAIIVFVGAATAVCITLEKGSNAIVEELSNIYGELLKRDGGKA